MSGAATRPRLLISVHNADRGDVGESWSNYKWVEGLSHSCDVTLVSLAYPRTTPLAEQLPGVTVHEVPRLPVVSRFGRFDSMAQPSFVRLRSRARRIARQMSRQGELDLCHSLGPMAVRSPSPFTGLGLPFVHGPIGGSVTAPAAMGLGAFPEKWYVRLRSLDRVRFRFDPALRRTVREASRVLAVGAYVGAYFREWDEARAVYMSETGVESVAERIERPVRAVPRVLFVGRMVPSKGVHLLLEALALVAACTPFDATLVGEGFLRPRLEERTRELGLTDRVRFTGRLPRERVMSLYEESDVFAFPSLEEASGNVVFEAMSRGLPTVAVDAGGPAAVIDATRGALVPALERDAFVRDYAAALARFLGDPALRERCGAAARAEVERRHVWPRKIEALRAVYDDVLARR